MFTWIAGLVAIGGLIGILIPRLVNFQHYSVSLMVGFASGFFGYGWTMICQHYHLINL